MPSLRPRAFATVLPSLALLPALLALGHAPRAEERASDGVGTRFAPYADFNGKRVLAGAGDDAVLWNAETGALLFRLKGHAAPVTAVALSPDGRLLATGDGDEDGQAKTVKGGHEIIVWNGTTGAIVRRFTGHASAVTALRFSPDGARVLSVGRDGTAWVFRAEAGGEAYSRRDVTSGLDTAFTPDGRAIVALQSGGISAWETVTGSRLLRIEPPNPERPLRFLALAPDLTRVAGSDGGTFVGVWNARSGELERELPPHYEGISGLLFTPDGARLLTAANDGIVRIWRAKDGGYVREMRSGGPVTAMLLSPDGKRLFTKWGAGLGDEASQGATLWNVANGKETLRLTAKEAIFGRGLVGFSPTSLSFLLLNRPATIRRTSSGDLVRRLDLE